MNHTLKEKLHSLLSYYLGTRGVGHSRVLAQGLGKEPTLVLVGTRAVGESLRRLLHTYSLSWGDGDFARRLYGRKEPLLIDNSAMIYLLTDTLAYIRDLETKLYRKHPRPQTDEDFALLEVLSTYTGNSDPTWNPLESLDDAWGLVNLVAEEDEGVRVVFAATLPFDGRSSSQDMARAICRAAANAWRLTI